VKNNEIISFGYNGNYDNKHRDCIAAGTCLRDENRIADNEIFEPCLREELGLELSDEDLNGVDVYISCYDKIQQKFMQTDIDEACLQCLSTAGVHRVIFAV
jgi:deoxycytidylate deaminase